MDNRFSPFSFISFFSIFLFSFSCNSRESDSYEVNKVNKTYSLENNSIHEPNQSEQLESNEVKRLLNQIKGSYPWGGEAIRYARKLAEVKGGLKALYAQVIDDLHKQKERLSLGNVSSLDEFHKELYEMSEYALSGIDEKARPLFYDGLESKDPVERIVCAQMLAREGSKKGMLKLIESIKKEKDLWILNRAMTGVTIIDLWARKNEILRDINSPFIITKNNLSNDFEEYRDELAAAMEAYMSKIEFDEKGYSGIKYE